MAKYSSENPNRIVRIDGNNVFVEAVSDSFSIDKLKLVFVQYDHNTHRKVSGIEIYLNIGQVLSLCHSLSNGDIAREHYARTMQQLQLNQQAQANPNANIDTKIPIKTVWSNPYMGTPAKKANRPDGKAEHRSLTLTLGNKVMFKAESGPGKELSKGQITKDYTTPDKAISVNVEWSELSDFFFTIDAHIRAYINSLYPEKARRYEYNSETKTYVPFDPNRPRSNFQNNEGWYDATQDNQNPQQNTNWNNGGQTHQTQATNANWNNATQTNQVQSNQANWNNGTQANQTQATNANWNNGTQGNPNLQNNGNWNNGTQGNPNSQNHGNWNQNQVTAFVQPNVNPWGY